MTPVLEWIVEHPIIDLAAIGAIATVVIASIEWKRYKRASIQRIAEQQILNKNHSERIKKLEEKDEKLDRKLDGVQNELTQIGHGVSEIKGYLRGKGEGE